MTMRRLVVTAVATLATAGALGAAAPAQAQEDGGVCVEEGSTGTILDGACFITQGEDGTCIGTNGPCVSGIPENLQAIRDFIADLRDLIPDPPEQVCIGGKVPPNPICITP